MSKIIKSAFLPLNNNNNKTCLIKRHLSTHTHAAHTSRSGLSLVYPSTSFTGSAFGTFQSPIPSASIPIFSRTNFPALTSNLITRSFYTSAPSHFHSTKQPSKPHSSKPQKFLESSLVTNTSPHAILNFFDKRIPTQRKPFILAHGAAGIPKHHDTLIPNIEKGKYSSIACGEDSFFRRHDALGVADGVGGWRHAPPMKHVVANSAVYSRKLMHYAHLELEKYNNVDNYYKYNDTDPVQILQASYDQSERDCALERVIGSSTALIAILRGDELRIANLGDCGIAVIRHDDIIFRNEEQQHSFNYPFQLGTGSFDSPSDAQSFTIKIKRGDIVVMGSDGLFDNLFDQDIIEEVVNLTRATRNGLPVEPQTISEALAWRAKTVSEDLANPSPFQSRALYEGMYYQGGKMDDISVIVATVADSPE